MGKTSLKWAKLQLDMEQSEAFQDLNAPTLKILLNTILQIRWVNIGSKRNKNWIIENKNDIKLPYSKFSKPPYNMNPKTIRDSIDSLLVHGFLSIKDRGGQYEGKLTTYSISDKWKEWIPGMIIEERPKSFKKAFKKNS